MQWRKWQTLRGQQLTLQLLSCRSQIKNKVGDEFTLQHLLKRSHQLQASLNVRVWTTAWTGSGRIHTSHFCSRPSLQTGFSFWAKLSTCQASSKEERGWVSRKLTTGISFIICQLPVHFKWYNHKTCFKIHLTDCKKPTVKELT